MLSRSRSAAANNAAQCRSDKDIERGDIVFLEKQSSKPSVRSSMILCSVFHNGSTDLDIGTSDHDEIHRITPAFDASDTAERMLLGREIAAVSRMNRRAMGFTARPE